MSPPSYTSRPASISSRAPSYDDNAPTVTALALDGGGVRGVASAVVIDIITEDYRAATGESTLPADLFNIIGGTSTGGLIGIVLGRLRATTNELITLYHELSKQLFRSKIGALRALFSGHRYAAADAERLFSKIVEDHSEDKDPKTLMNEQTNPTKVFVTAVDNADSTGQPLLLRSYVDASDPVLKPDITIADAARATTAAPAYFPPKRLPDNTYAIDGGITANNPSELVIKEARSQYGAGVRFGLFLSIGTGTKGPSPLVLTSALSIFSTTKSLANIVTDSERMHERVYERFNECMMGNYVRINVPEIGDIALDNYKAIPKIIEMTREYMETEEMKERRKEITDYLIETRKGSY